MQNSVVELVAISLRRFRRFRDANPKLFPNLRSCYPIPFFGDIRRATVLTLALNPAWTEFGHERYWRPELDAYALATRLLHYFDLPLPTPHDWFRHRHKALTMLGCSYETNTAHIDLHPLPTKFRESLTASQRKDLGRLIEARSKSHLEGLINLAAEAKLLLVVDYTFSKSDGTATTTSDFISTHQPIVELLEANAGRLQVFRGGGIDEFEDRIAAHRNSLRENLRLPAL